ALRDRLDRLEIGLDPRAMGNFVIIRIEHQERIDEIALTLRLGTHGLGLLDRRKTEGKISRRRRIMRIVEHAQRNAPISDPAFWIGLEHFLENLLGFPIPERMLVSHATVKPPLRRLVA